MSEIRNILSTCFTKKIKVFVIQGPSASGKTTFANNLYECISKTENVLKIHLDNYFKTVKNEDYTKYDFDNPAVYNWENIKNLIQAINDEEEYLPTFQFCFLKRESKGPIYTKNSFPKILIIEGCYALNIFNEFIFDIEKFNPNDSSVGGYTKNTTKYDNLGVLSIKLMVCRQKLLTAKIQRDIAERNHTYDEAKFMFEKQSWPAAKKWVYSEMFKAHINLIHGTFNEKNYKKIFQELTLNVVGNAQFNHRLTSDVESVNCSFECLEDTSSQILVKDC